MNQYVDFSTEGYDVEVSAEIRNEMVYELIVTYRGVNVTGTYSAYELLKLEHKALKEYDRHRNDNVVRIKDRLEDE